MITADSGLTSCTDDHTEGQSTEVAIRKMMRIAISATTESTSGLAICQRRAHADSGVGLVRSSVMAG